jgi:type IV pilus assembly protein PilF
MSSISTIKVTMITAMIAALVGCQQHSKHQDISTGPDYQRAANLNVQLGYGYLEQGQVALAKTKLLHALELVPNLPTGLAAMGFFWEKVGDNKEAERYYKKAISAGHGSGELYSKYANFLCRTGAYRDAEHNFHKALQDRKTINTAEIYESAGLCALTADEPQKAEQYFEKAARYDASQKKDYQHYLEEYYKNHSHLKPPKDLAE